MKYPSLGYLPFLDGLRAVAVLGVVLFHYNLCYLTGGYAGVDIFFVLSGFLITSVIDTAIQQQTFTFAHFYERRCRRILPALFIVCGLSVITALLLLVPYDFKNFAKSLKGTALFYSNIIFARSNGYFADPLSMRPLLHTWSLAVEEQFYLIFPPFFYGLYHVTKANRKVVCCVIGLLFCASLLANLIMITTSPDKTFYILPTRAWELLTGALVFLILRHITLSRNVAEILAWIGVLFITLSFVFYDRNTLFPGWAALLPCAGAALIIWPNLQTTTLPGRILSTRPIVLIGLISYGLYLYHWPVIVFARYYFDRELSAPEVVAAIIVTFSLSILSYSLIEKPIRSGKILVTRKGVFQFSALGILFFTSCALTAIHFDGFSSRFSGTVLQYAAGNSDNPDWERHVPAFKDLNNDTVIKLGNSHGNPTFLLWGDSHAEALAPAIETQAKAFGTTGLFIEYSGCLPLLGVSRLDHAPKNAPCQLVGQKVLGLFTHYHIHNVILAGRWDDVFGWEKGSIETGQPEAVTAFTASDGTEFKGGAAFAPAFKETINQLTSLGIHIWVIEQVPPQLIDVPSALAKAVYLGRDPEKLERSYQDIEQRRKETNDVFHNFRVVRNVSFIDPADKLCPAQKFCMIANDGHALYRDSNHLSIYGSLWIRDILDPFFKALRHSQ
jgi:peptidoglycan/LPS O-acetylase OafA/YrhL